MRCYAAGVEEYEAASFANLAADATIKKQGLLYYNDQKATDDKIAFNKLLDGLEEELTSGKRTQEHEKLYMKYYEINETPVSGMTLIPIQEAIESAEKDYGFLP